MIDSEIKKLADYEFTHNRQKSDIVNAIKNRLKKNKEKELASFLDQD
jgi:hypothetical protein